MQRCPVCEQDLPEGEFSPSNRGRPGTYCRACRREKYRERRPVESRPCASCGETIEHPFRSDVRFCSANCRAADVRKRRRAGELPPERKAAAPLSQRGTVVTATCARCDQEFTYRRVGRSRARCDACRAAEGRIERTGGRYGMTVAEMTAYRASITACAICGATSPGRGFTGWHIDHDHVTGARRGALCGACNLGLGHFADDVDRMLRAVNYLRTHDRGAAT